MDDLRQLVLDAYSRARAQGRPDWYRMNIGVLKNRLLNATDGHFSESSYGKKNMREVVSAFPDILRLDDATTPPTVELLAESQRHSGQAQAATVGPMIPRIRHDLWEAMVDYSSGVRYIWNPEKGIAEPVPDDDEAGDYLPTLTQAEFSDLRADFIASVGNNVLPSVRDRLDEWQAKGLNNAALPSQLRGQWYAYLKSAIQTRLNAWFSTRSGPKEVAPSPAAPPPIEELASSASELRAAIIECLGTMTLQELERVQVPASVLVRYRGAK